MISIPLPHVVALFIAVFLAAMARNGELLKRENRPFMILIGVYAIQSILVGCHWGYGILAVLPFQAVLATLIPGLCWISFSSLTRESGNWQARHIWPHLAPAVVTLALVLYQPALIDIFIILVFFIYGLLLLQLARRGPDGLVSSRLDGAIRSFRAMQITGVTLILSSASDTIISLDRIWSGGRYSGAVIAGASILSILLLGGAAFAASTGAAEEEIEVAENEKPRALQITGEDADIAAAVDAFMQSSELYKDMELNLAKLARRMRLPARAVSNAINRIHGVSVSQYVNNYRIKAACTLLTGTDESITSIIYGAGFMTKSNFNREFLRVTGTTPSGWRRDHGSLLSGDQKRASG